jgi:hypothetical protein
MGLFDFFKKADGAKKAAAKPTAEESTVTPETTGAEEEVPSELTAQCSNTEELPQQDIPQRISGDLNKTQSLAILLNTPREGRNETWVKQFLTDLPFAALRCGTPQLIAGPDGFPYFQLFIPEPGEEFQSYVIHEMISGFMVERGYGIVINPGEDQPDWILTYGDILNYHLNGYFFALESHFSNSSNAQQEIPEGEEVMIGQPSESILPVQTRKLLKDFFELNGIIHPKVMLIQRKNFGNVSQDLAFNITPHFFESEEHYRNMMQTVTWYLPRHYSIVGLAESNAENGFKPL